MGNTQSYHPTLTQSCIDKNRKCLSKDAFWKIEGNQNAFEIMGESSKFIKNLGLSQSDEDSGEDSKTLLNKKCSAKYPGTEFYYNACCDPQFKGKYDNLLFSSNNGTITKNTLKGIPREALPSLANLSNSNGDTYCGKEYKDEIFQKVYDICQENSQNCDVPESFQDDVLKICTDNGYDKVVDAYKMCIHTFTKKDSEFLKDGEFNNIAVIDCAEPLPFCDALDNLAKIEKAVADTKSMSEAEKTKALADAAIKAEADKTQALANLKTTTEAQIKAITDLKNTTEAEKNKMIADIKNATEAEKKAILDKIAEDTKKKEAESDKTWMIIVGSSVIGLLLLFIIIFAMMR
jgi:hypothetical protein